MIRYFQKVLNPAGYHGHGKVPPFFEGWYYKIVDASAQIRYAIIPGIFLSRDPNKQHAFVQVLNGQTGQVRYHRYPVQEFWAAKSALDLQIGPNRFTKDQMVLNIESPQETLVGTLCFEEVTPWPVTFKSPGIMGWYAWVPFMECYHGVVSLDHEIRGTLTMNGRAIDFDQGRGYIEKDWGRSFPEAWVWFQTNHFGQPGTSLTASIAIIPWVRRSFPGFIIGLWHEAHLYRFSTYGGAQVEQLAITDQQVDWTVRDKLFRLEMRATRAAGGLLHAPTTLDMGRRIAETLDATVQVRLHSIQNGHSHGVYEGVGRHAGLEAVGELGRLQTEVKMGTRGGKQ